MQARHDTTDVAGEGSLAEESARAITAPRVPGAISMALVTAGTLGGLYGALALAVQSG